MYTSHVEKLYNTLLYIVLSTRHTHNKASRNMEQQQVVSSTKDSESPPPKLEEQVHNLQRRISNIQTSIHLSTTALQSDVTIWEQNCLNPIRRCVRSWKTIVSMYVRDVATYEIPTPASATMKETPLKLYVLIQLSLQCGPLKGCTAGYFKRCGTRVVQISLHYLQSLIELLGPSHDDLPESAAEPIDSDDANAKYVKDQEDRRQQQEEQQEAEHQQHKYLYFTQKQYSSLLKWRNAAVKCLEEKEGISVTNNKDLEESVQDLNIKPPSKSMVKLQHRALQQQMKKKQVKTKKIEKRKKQEVA